MAGEIKTSIAEVKATKLGKFVAQNVPGDILDTLSIELDASAADTQALLQAARLLRDADVPVAFPTETVYGLGADATRSEAVRGIYKAKQRPSDNPLIVHFASLQQIRHLLMSKADNQLSGQIVEDPIPLIYHPLISRFWPGPLTILLRNTPNSRLAPEVTAGLSTFGARIPRHPVALALIQQAAVPVAAPSANASTKPSPTAAEHVAHDLDGRIELILDAGPCEVGVESTVVDGLSQPPSILRPGGISLEQIRSCPGWENVEIGYKDKAQEGAQPRAPGMKYRHYSPKAPVLLVEADSPPPSLAEVSAYCSTSKVVGLVRTSCWSLHLGPGHWITKDKQYNNGTRSNGTSALPGFADMLQTIHTQREIQQAVRHPVDRNKEMEAIVDIQLGQSAAEVARGIFAALRRLDDVNAGVIVVEGIDDAGDDLAAAVMNRLRKAAEIVK